jgi:hypothetical protein
VPDKKEVNTQDQRKDGVKLAIQLNATKTLEVIKDPSQGIEAILKSAVAEVGLNKLVSIILDNNYSYWALGALRYLPNLGEYETPLREKAGIVFLPPDNQPRPGGDRSLRRVEEAAAGAGALPSINTFYMYLACGVGYVANFTMWYFTPPFSNQWIRSTVDSGDKVPVCQGTTQLCAFFSNPDIPLKTGDTVMMVVGIAGNKDWVPTDIWFTYDPAALYTGEIDCHGQTLNPYFTWSVKKS